MSESTFFGIGPAEGLGHSCVEVGDELLNLGLQHIFADEVAAAEEFKVPGRILAGELCKAKAGSRSLRLKISPTSLRLKTCSALAAPLLLQPFSKNVNPSYRGSGHEINMEMDRPGIA
jgi:hypothetical protein